MGRPASCGCGSCAKCRRNTYARDYYRRNAERGREIARASRARRIEDVRALDRARGHRVYDHAAELARRVVSHAIRDGKLTPQPCETCGAKGEAHHDDYGRPLDVRWLCRTHHMEVHRVFV